MRALPSAGLAPAQRMTAFPPLFQCLLREQCASLSLSSSGGLHPSSLRVQDALSSADFSCCGGLLPSVRFFLTALAGRCRGPSPFRRLPVPSVISGCTSLLLTKQITGIEVVLPFPSHRQPAFSGRSARQAQAGGVNNAFYNNAFSFARLPALHALRFLRRTASHQVTSSSWWPHSAVRFFFMPQSGRSGRPSRPVPLPPSLFGRAPAAPNIR